MFQPGEEGVSIGPLADFRLGGPFHPKPLFSRFPPFSGRKLYLNIIITTCMEVRLLLWKDIYSKQFKAMK